MTEEQIIFQLKRLCLEAKKWGEGIEGGGSPTMERLSVFTNICFLQTSLIEKLEKRISELEEITRS